MTAARDNKQIEQDNKFSILHCLGLAYLFSIWSQFKTLQDGIIVLSVFVYKQLSS